MFLHKAACSKLLVILSLRTVVAHIASVPSPVTFYERDDADTNEMQWLVMQDLRY